MSPEEGAMSSATTHTARDSSRGNLTALYAPPPRLRDQVRTILYPSSDPATGRRAVWVGAIAMLAMVFAAGVLVPLAKPDWMQRGMSVVAGAEVTYPARTRLRDCADEGCPWLVVIPAGSFTMGSPKDEAGRDDDEGPEHAVTLAKPFAIMEAEVTRAQFEFFVTDSGYAMQGECSTWTGKTWEPAGDWRDPGFSQTPDHPAVCVSWEDAQAYARWISTRTGKEYRLPSEAQWEYMARAGSRSRFSFGNEDARLCEHANVGDRRTKAGFPGWNKEWIAAECDDGFVYTAPVKSYEPSAFGVHGVHGNAVEWVEDCWHDNYDDAPEDGSAWTTKCGSSRVLRGGGWDYDPREARSANRNGFDAGDRNVIVGFRLARTLTP